MSMRGYASQGDGNAPPRSTLCIRGSTYSFFCVNGNVFLHAAELPKKAARKGEGSAQKEKGDPKTAPSELNRMAQMQDI